MKKIILIGDSYVGFFSKTLSGWEDLFDPQAFNHASGSSTILHEDYELSFIWKSGLPTARVNTKYLNERLANSNISIDKDDAVSFVFVFGRSDLQNRIHTIYDVDKVLLNYMNKCLDFCSQYSASAFFCTPIIHEKYTPITFINYFNNLLGFFCETMDRANLIDFTKIISPNHESDPRDKDTHLTLEDSKKALSFMLDTIEAGGS